jgi:arylsulfatase A-like enzyme
MDKTIGRILRQLKADGLADNTIVMFFGDNGRIEPRGIHWCYDTGIHVPLESLQREVFSDQTLDA